MRQCWHLPLFGSKSVSSSRAEYFLYEAQVSVAVTGFDDSVWTAYGIVDTYFGTKESIRRYDRFTTGHSSGRPDPLAAGQINADVPIWNPREYFLRVFEIRIIQISREWDFILDRVEDAVKQYVQSGFRLDFSHSSSHLNFVVGIAQIVTQSRKQISSPCSLHHDVVSAVLWRKSD